MLYERDKLIADLRESVIEVTFTKVNGEKRIMRCTLDQKQIPQTIDYNHLKEQHARKENLDVIAAWDVQANGWRSFRVDSVQYVQVVEGY
jgi:2-C-methyl-D-erythritol 4-phosphate cytidylyltransferase